MAAKNSYKIIPIHLKMVYAFLLKKEDGKSIIIDCGIPGSETYILKSMDENGVKYSDLQLIIITHGHDDHMGSICNLRKATGAKTVIHKLDSDVIRTGKSPELHPTNLLGKFFNLFVKGGIAGFTPYEPEIIVDGELSLSEYGFDGRIIETPGHTNGSVSVIMDDGNIFIGDLIMGSMMGKGKPNFPMYADDVQKVKESIKKVIALSPKTVYCGHGGPFSYAEVKSLAAKLNI